MLITNACQGEMAWKGNQSESAMMGPYDLS